MSLYDPRYGWLHTITKTNKLEETHLQSDKIMRKAQIRWARHVSIIFDKNFSTINLKMAREKFDLMKTL